MDAWTRSNSVLPVRMGRSSRWTRKRGCLEIHRAPEVTTLTEALAQLDEGRTDWEWFRFWTVGDGQAVIDAARRMADLEAKVADGAEVWVETKCTCVTPWRVDEGCQAKREKVMG